MLPDEKIECHRLPRKCRDGVVNEYCQLWTTLKGVDAEGKHVDVHGCADSFIPKLLIENAQQSRQAAASVDALRAELKQADEAATDRAREALAQLGSGGARLVGNR